MLVESQGCWWKDRGAGEEAWVLVERQESRGRDRGHGVDVKINNHC